MPLVTEKASLLLPRQTGAQKDCERPATDIEHGMAYHLFGTHSRLSSEVTVQSFCHCYSVYFSFHTLFWLVPGRFKVCFVKC